MPAGIAAMSASVIEPIGNGDAITISRRAGGAVSSQSDRAADAVGKRGARERLLSQKAAGPLRARGPAEPAAHVASVDHDRARTTRRSHA